MDETAMMVCKERKRPMVAHRGDLDIAAIHAITRALRHLLADVFVLYLKTKSFHWHMTGRNFRDYHILLDEHSDQLFAMTDVIAERTRKLGESTLRSIGDIVHHQRLSDNSTASMSPEQMLGQLLNDNQTLTGFLRTTHEICERGKDVATASVLEVWIDETERRSWFLWEISTGT